MTAIRKMSELFEPAPVQWGLRGDPYLWVEMASALADAPLPATGAQLDTLLEDTFERLVGAPLDPTASSVFVERYHHGGMSSGRISFAFWRETGFPLLRSRHAGIQ
jgi:hypothetical protein